MNSIKGLIKNGRIWTGKEFVLGDVAIDNGIVVGLGGKQEIDGWFEFDAKCAIISAGLVDTHMHMQNISCDEFGIPAESSCYPFGVTTANDASAEKGTKEYISKLSIGASCFVCVKTRDNHADLDDARKRLEEYGEYALGLKVFFDTSDKGLRDATPLKEVVAFAKEKGLKVMVHTTNSPIKAYEIVEILSSGDIFTHIYHGGNNQTLEDDYLAFKLAKQKGVIMDAGMAGGVHTDFKVAKTCVENGFIPDTISTDLTCCSAFMRGGKYGMTECLSILHYLGMSEEELLLATTHNAALALGKSDECGMLKVGGVADIAVLDYTDNGFDITDKASNNIKCDKGYECLLTIKRGCVVYRR